MGGAHLGEPRLEGNTLKQTLLDVIESISRVIGSVSGTIGGFIIFAMTMLITIDVLGRYLFSKPTMVATEISGYMLVGITFLGLAFTQRQGRNVEIIMLTQKLSKKLQKQIRTVNLVVSVAVALWLTWATTTPVIENYTFHRISITELRTPMWIPWLMVPAGAFMLTIELVVELYKEIVSLRKSRSI